LSEPWNDLDWVPESGDAAIEGSREYADYRDQLISEDEAAKMTAAYQQEAGISIDAQRFVSERRQCSRRSRSRQTARFARTLLSVLRMVSLF
jgi:hypothetical protein